MQLTINIITLSAPEFNGCEKKKEAGCHTVVYAEKAFLEKRLMYDLLESGRKEGARR